MERKNRSKALINNQFYDDLQEGWYTSNNHPIVLLRAENRVRIPWIIQCVAEHFSKKCTVLDIGCGAGMLTNELSMQDHDVTGIDLSEQSLEIAKKYDQTKKVKYVYGDAYDLPFAEHSFDVVCAMDVLEHVENPSKLVKEASRVLKHGGLFFFHTFHKNLLSYFFVIKCVEWFVPNTPRNMHVYDLFIKPKDLHTICVSSGLIIQKIHGFQPKVFSKGIFNLLVKRKMDDTFPFTFTKKVRSGYCGFAIK